MMNMDAENTAILIRSLLIVIKQHEGTVSAACFKLAEKTKKIEFLEKQIEELRRQVDNLTPKIKRGRGRPRKVQP